MEQLKFEPLGKKETRDLILKTIPEYLIQADDLWRKCGSPYPKNADYSRCVLDLVDEGLIVSGKLQKPDDRYSLMAYRSR